MDSIRFLIMVPHPWEFNLWPAFVVSGRDMPSYETFYEIRLFNTILAGVAVTPEVQNAVDAVVDFVRGRFE